MLRPHLPSFDDEEGEIVPAGLPSAVDAHVHLFPRNIFSAIWSWFDENAWPIRYRLPSSQVLEYLLCRGIRHVVALQYAHKPGISRMLNHHMIETCEAFAGRVTGLAAVFPGEAGSGEILEEAFGGGLKGVKLHAHVQCFDMNGDGAAVIYDACQSAQKPILMHVGREPKSTAYHCDPYEICNAEKLERVLRGYPGLKICVPHLGFDEISAYRELIEKYDNLWLDTTMMLAGYFPLKEPINLGAFRADRVMYGSDFPNIPYAWDRELKWLEASGLPGESLAWILHRSAAAFFGLDEGQGEEGQEGDLPQSGRGGGRDVRKLLTP